MRYNFTARLTAITNPIFLENQSLANVDRFAQHPLYWNVLGRDSKTLVLALTSYF